jgi:hypothetical protein
LLFLFYGGVLITGTALSVAATPVDYGKENKGILGWRLEY